MEWGRFCPILYTALNGNRPVVIQTVGRKVARDPYIIKGQGGGYYMLATDLKGGDKTQELTNKGRIFGAPIPVLPPGILRSW